MKESILIVGEANARIDIRTIAFAGHGIVLSCALQEETQLKPEPLMFPITCMDIPEYKPTFNKKTYIKNAPRYKGKR